MATTAKLTHTKALGWYAVQRVRVADWFKPHHSKTHASKTSDNSSPATGSDKSKAKHTLETPSKNGEDVKKLRAVVRESHTILAKAHSVFPLQFFPDSLNIDRHKLTITRRQFFGVEQTVSVPIENIKNVEADFGPFFGSITITSDLFINNTQTINFLWRDDAKKIQKLVQGAVVALRENIDLNNIDIKQLQELLMDLGSRHTKQMKKS